MIRITLYGEEIKAMRAGFEGANCKIFLPQQNQTFTEFFEQLVEAYGGEIRTSAEVTRIIIRDGKAEGVETATGEVLHAKNVIASTAPGQLYDGLLGG